MSWKKDYQKLYDRVRKKLGNLSESTFDKRLQRKSNTFGLASSEAALVVIAAENDVGYRTEFQRLNEARQNRVAQIIQGLNGNLVGSSDAGSSKISKMKSIKSTLEIGDFTDPTLSDSLYKGIPYEGYAIMFVLENSIRNFISRVLQNTNGDQWWNHVKGKKSLANLVKNVDQRKTTDSENWYHSKRGAHEVFYTDYSELLQIMRVLQTDFQPFFKKGAEKILLDKLSELTPTRNVIAHNNPITEDDLERLKVHAKDWFKYMQHLSLQKQS